MHATSQTADFTRRSTAGLPWTSVPPRCLRRAAT